MKEQTYKFKDKFDFKKQLFKKTNCGIQYDGWCCGTCFFNLSKTLNNSDWQNLLLYRGDNKEEELNNLPKNKVKSLNKIWNLLQVEE